MLLINNLCEYTHTKNWTNVQAWPKVNKNKTHTKKNKLNKFIIILNEILFTKKYINIFNKILKVKIWQHSSNLKYKNLLKNYSLV